MSDSPAIAVIGDCHGHLQLALCVAARWQEELGVHFTAVFLCGDVGTFTTENELDSATRSHARDNACELEFLTQWSTTPPAPWLDAIFRPTTDDGLGLCCPIAMIHGNHEGFAYLTKLVPPDAKLPRAPVSIGDLPAVDSGSHIRLLPSGWTVRLPSGHSVAGIGGIERGQRRARYHEMAYLRDDAIDHIASNGRVDLLLTHQGPAQVQGEASGSKSLDLLLDERVANVWFHGHAVPKPSIATFRGPRETTVVPLADIAFSTKSDRFFMPGTGGWAWVDLSGSSPVAQRFDPACLREFPRTKWSKTAAGLWVSPTLKAAARDWLLW